MEKKKTPSSIPVSGQKRVDACSMCIFGCKRNDCCWVALATSCDSRLDIREKIGERRYGGGGRGRSRSKKQQRQSAMVFIFGDNTKHRWYTNRAASRPTIFLFVMFGVGQLATDHAEISLHLAQVGAGDNVEDNWHPLYSQYESTSNSVVVVASPYLNFKVLVGSAIQTQWAVISHTVAVVVVVVVDVDVVYSSCCYCHFTTVDVDVVVVVVVVVIVSLVILLLLLLSLSLLLNGFVEIIFHFLFSAISDTKFFFSLFIWFLLPKVFFSLFKI